MTIRTVIEGAIPGVAWARLIAYVVGGLLSLALVWFGIDRLFFAPHRAHVAAVQASVDRKAAAAAAETGKDALATTQQVQVVHDRIERITEINHDRILAAPGASAALPPAVDAAWLNAVCLRDVYLADPACVGVRSAAASVSDRPDAGGANPG